MDPEELPRRYGLRMGTAHRPALEKAINMANAILGPTAAVRFRKSTEAGEGAPVYLVRGSALGPTEYCFVPKGERCVFVNDARLDDALELFAGDPSGALAVAPEEILALMLLHEGGHLVAGDAGSYTAPVKLDVDELSGELNASKSRELRADSFAVSAIRAAFRPGQPMPRFLAAGALEAALTKVSWNLATRRLIGAFAANALRERRLFLDEGYTHPNFELRFLVMNYRLQPSDAARALLLDFLAGREGPAVGAFSQRSPLGIPSFEQRPSERP